MRHPVIASLAAVLAATPSFAQDTALAARIRRVENGLLTPVVVAGRTDQGMSLAERMRALNTPAVSIAVISDGRIEWARAYGSLQAGGAPADTGTLFQAASMSKPVATLGALLLVRDGRLSLDADVNTFLRSWRVPENAFTLRAPVTLRRIVSHSAGLTVGGFPGYAADSVIPATVQVLDGARPANTAPVRVDTLPGELLRYSGGGMTVMQLMMEDVSGQRFPWLMYRSVLRPLGMVHSTYDYRVPAEMEARIARGHRRDGAPIPGGWHRYPEMAAAGLWTTPLDLARFMVAVHRAYQGQAVGPITPELARQILTPQMTDPANGRGFGLGMGVEQVGTPAMNYGHGGANEGYRGRMIMFPETGRGAVIMTSSDLGGDLIIEILRSLAREYGWPAYRPVEKTAVAMDPAALRDAPGRYRLVADGDTAILSFTAEGGQLVGRGPNWPTPRVFYPLSASEPRFFVRESEREYVFERDETGRVVRLRIAGTGPELVAPRVD